MTLPAWVGRDVHCICIDDAWTDIDTGARTVATAPINGLRYTVSGAHDIGDGYLILAEFGGRPDLWSVAAFRPLTAAEQRDLETFNRILKGASEKRLREMELLL